MHHRHLQAEGLSLAAVDDIIVRGGWRDWVDLRRAALRDPQVLARIERVCGAVRGPEAEGRQRLEFWRKYVQRTAAPVG